MPHLHPDSPSVVGRIFDIDEKSLTRAGFTLPAEYKVTADDARPRTEVVTTIGTTGLTGAHAEAYERALNMGLDERAYE